MAITKRGAAKELAEGIEALDNAAEKFDSVEKTLRQLSNAKQDDWNNASTLLAFDFANISKFLKTAAKGLKASYLLHRKTFKLLKEGPRTEY